MKWTGKIIGALVGLLMASPLLFLVGVFLGHLRDIGWFAKWFGFVQSSARPHGSVQEVFFNCSFLVMGHLAKCDGRVSENEIRLAQKVMDSMNLSASMKKEAIRLFNQGKLPEFDLRQTLNQLRMTCWTSPSLLRVFIEIQVKMAHADDKELSSEKRRTLEYICRYLGAMRFRFSDFERHYQTGQSYGGYQYSHTASQANHGSSSLKSAYQLLGIAKTATDSEVKKAYRRLMSQHHPDKLMSKGLPPELLKVATEKTQQIKDAYEQICKARKRS